MNETEINDYLSKCDEDLANNVIYRVYGMPGPIFMEENIDTPTPEPPTPPTPPTPVVDLTTPFYIANISGNEVTVTVTKHGNAADVKLTLYQSTDGEMWESMSTSTATIPANGILYLRCSVNKWGASDQYYNVMNFTGRCNIGGNIMSLIYGSSFNGQTTFITNKKSWAFARLFEYNENIVDASNLLLPATDIGPGTYFGMFTGCTSLTTAPSLPAATLAGDCYGYMFRNCSSLNHIECFATNISALNCTTDWVNGVAASGTFVKDPNMSGWTTGNNGIPDGWTVQDATN